jgi:replicative DNA helicase
MSRAYKPHEAVLCLLARDEENWKLFHSLGLTVDNFPDEDSKDLAVSLKNMVSQGVSTRHIENLEYSLSESQMTKWRDVFVNGPIAQDIRFFARGMVTHAKYSEVMSGLSDLMGKFGKANPFNPPDELLGELHAFSTKATQGDTGYSTGESVAKLLERYCEEYDNRTGGDVSGVTTGIRNLDQMLSGFCPGSVYTLAARTGLGKTTLACNFALYAAASGARVAFFTIEMTADELLEKFMSHLSGVPVLKMQNKLMNDLELDRFFTAKNKLAEMDIKIFDIDTNFAKLQAQLAALNAMKNIDLVVIDYIQLLKQPGNNFKARNYELGDISTELKLMAKTMGVPFIVLAQLNRNVETNDGMREPQLSDLKDSGSIEQDANCIMFIHLEGNQYKLLVKKNRKGPVGAIPLKVDMRTNRMEGADEIQAGRMPYKD